MDDYFYYTKVIENKDFELYYRRKEGSDKEELVIDCNKEAEGKAYFSLFHFKISHDHKQVAYTVDFEGKEHYYLRIKEIETNQIRDLSFLGPMLSVEWDHSGKVIFYTVPDRLGFFFFIFLFYIFLFFLKNFFFKNKNNIF